MSVPPYFDANFGNNNTTDLSTAAASKRGPENDLDPANKRPKLQERDENMFSRFGYMINMGRVDANIQDPFENTNMVPVGHAKKEPRDAERRIVGASFDTDGNVLYEVVDLVSNGNRTGYGSTYLDSAWEDSYTFDTLADAKEWIDFYDVVGVKPEDTTDYAVRKFVFKHTPQQYKAELGWASIPDMDSFPWIQPLMCDSKQISTALLAFTSADRKSDQDVMLAGLQYEIAISHFCSQIHDELTAILSTAPTSIDAGRDQAVNVERSVWKWWATMNLTLFQIRNGTLARHQDE